MQQMTSKPMWPIPLGNDRDKDKDNLSTLWLLRIDLSEDLCKRIDKLSYPVRDHYKKARIPKRSGGIRTLNVPDEELKAIQRSILKAINGVRRSWVRSNVFGFVLGKSVADNALFHRHSLTYNYIKSYVLQAQGTKKHGSAQLNSLIAQNSATIQKTITRKHVFFDVRVANPAVRRSELKRLVPNNAVRIDIKDAFNSISVRLITDSLRKYTNLSEDNIDRIIKVCTFNGGLPQGAPTSPILMNLALIDFDDYCQALIRSKIAKRFRVPVNDVKYSRYADDITISSNVPGISKKCVGVVRGVCGRFGLKINEKKTKIMTESTGIFINGINIINAYNHISVSRKSRSKVRAAINNAALIKDEDQYSFLKMQKEILGRISYINSLDRVHGTQLLKYAVQRNVLSSATKINGMSLDLKLIASNELTKARSRVFSAKKS
jgi:hypothetical protein